ncbi:MAG: tRNA uridine-5-carboxymethylaminomethyl(34) synthesis GTPase MnmE [Muribaculaceae bacterium]|nr:tRNA uridine-5-carboxymethylaminomethyl(34) synthesis GTPase MnmE [Muribaculaceae bacterium]
MNTYPTNLANDDICAVSTPPGTGGIAVIRLSGPHAIEIADRIWHGRALANAASHTAHFGHLHYPGSDAMLDECVATIFRAPASYTGENVVELAVHGSRFVQRELLDILVQSGARIAEPGEFTRRAFSAGKMDLAQAEAVADVIASTSRASHKIAISQMRGNFSKRLSDLRERLVDIASLLELELDFSEEDVEFASRDRLTQLTSDLIQETTRLKKSFATGNAIKEGIPVAIIGSTNAGKSSLLNTLLDDDRAIVSEIHGTTRDTIEETLTVGDYTFRFIDTAGIRDTSDAIERIGIRRSVQAMEKARIIILVIDAASKLDKTALEHTIGLIDCRSPHPKLIIALNKTDIASHTHDLKTAISDISVPPTDILEISAKTGHGIDRLKEMLQSEAESYLGNNSEDILVTNARHAQALDKALTSCTRLLDGLHTGLPGDLLTQDLRETLQHLASITGEIPSTEILATIFSRFCIGK